QPAEVRTIISARRRETEGAAPLLAQYQFFLLEHVERFAYGDPRNAELGGELLLRRHRCLGRPLAFADSLLKHHVDLIVTRYEIGHDEIDRRFANVASRRLTQSRHH